MTVGTTTNATDAVVAIDPLSTEWAPQTMGVPIVMPAEQEYYWRFSWQSEERQCLIELDTPQASITFDSDDPDDAARWLREPDDE